MEKVNIDLTRFTVTKKRRINEFYELCKFAADLWNRASVKQVPPHRFMRDCKTNYKAYELAQIDYTEMKGRCSNPQDHAKLFFGCLKRRKQ